MTRCIYCRSELNENDPSDDLTKSKEHIVPWALGGSEQFITWDASRKYNNDLGSDIDAPFMNLLPLAIKRHEFKIKGQGGTIPPIELKARSLDNGEPLTVVIDIDGNVQFNFETTVVDDTKSKYTERLVAGPPDRVHQILTGMLAKAKKKGNTIYSLIGEPMRDIADFTSHFEVEETDLVHASVQIDGETWVRGIFKILLGLGHVVLGPEWTFSMDGGDRIRSVLFLDRKDWPENSLRGFSAGALPDGIAYALGITEAVRNGGHHTIAILPGFEHPTAVVSLFGGNGIPEVMVSLGRERGYLAPVNDILKAGTRIGVRIDPRTRQAKWLTVDELAANCP